MERDERDAAARDLERIRALMERAGRYSNLSGYAAIVAGLLAIGGAAACKAVGAHFGRPSCIAVLAGIWGTVFVLAAVQAVVFTVVNAKQKGEPVWSPLTQQVVMAMLPALFVGGAITGYGLQTGQLTLLPPIWMLAHGMSLMGLGLFAGPVIKATGIAFLLLGTGALWWGCGHGLRTMILSFGVLHILLGAFITWKRRA